MVEQNKGFTIKESSDNQNQVKLPTINFSTFILSLHSSALVHLGVVANPVSGKKEKNKDIAKQTIDVISMLEQKTKGNLDVEEDRLIKHILHDLRLKFINERL
ncbi:MAG: DUF1844 domain-containing protein [Desulfobacterales bacterium]|nr:DUF1844 domain-containing protein [Desulfobacterales bacterium]